MGSEIVVDPNEMIYRLGKEIAALRVEVIARDIYIENLEAQLGQSRESQQSEG